MKKRILSMLLTIAMILTMAQPIFADSYVDDGIHSLITFAAAQYSVSEKDGSYEITVYREGNTQKAIDVALKAADFTAEYGKDYVVVIDNTELAKVDGISPEYSEFMETAQSAASYLVSEEIKGDATEEEAKEVLEALQNEAPANMPVVNAEGEIDQPMQLGTQLMVKPSEAKEQKAENEGSGMALLDQRAQLLGVSEDADSVQKQMQDVNDVLTQQSDYFDKAQGAFGVLHFGAGQSQKSFKLVLLDNDEAEADKVVLFALMGINGDDKAVLEANPTMFVSIMDDEEYETPVIVPSTRNIVLDKNDPSYELVLRRTSGINYFTTLTVSTVDGSAVPGTHYEALDEVKVSFAPGETEKIVKLSALRFDEDVYYGVRLFSDGTNEIAVKDRYIKVGISSTVKAKLANAFSAFSGSLTGQNKLTAASNSIDAQGIAGVQTVTLKLDDFIGKKDLILRHDGGYSRGKDYDIGKTVKNGVTEEVFTWETSKNNSTAVILPNPISTYGVCHFKEPYRLKTVGSGKYWGWIGIGDLGDSTYDRDNHYQRNGFDGDDDDGDNYVSEFNITPDYWTEKAYLRGFVKSTSKGDHDPYLYMKNPITLTMQKYNFIDALSTKEMETPVVFNYNFDFAHNAVSFEKDSSNLSKRYELPMVNLVAVGADNYSTNGAVVKGFYPALNGEDAVAITPVAPENSNLSDLGLVLDYALLYNKKGSLLYYPTDVNTETIQANYNASWMAGYTTLAAFLSNPAPDRLFDESNTYKLVSGTPYDLNQTFVKNYIENAGGGINIKVMPHYTRKGVTVKFYTAGGGTTHINNIYYKDQLKTDSIGTYNEYTIPYGSKISFDATVGTKGSRLAGYQIVYSGDTSGHKGEDNVVKQVGDSTVCNNIVLDAEVVSVIPLLQSEQFKVEVYPDSVPEGTNLSGAVSWDMINENGETTDGGITTNTEGALALPQESVYMGMQWGFRATPEVYSADGYYTVWQNGTGDLNGNGRVDADEQNANTLSVGPEAYEEIVGNFVTGTLNQLSPKWYYSFEKLENGKSIDLSGTVRKVNASFYDLTSMDEIDMRLPQNLKPVAGATVTILASQAATDINGKFELTLDGVSKAGRISFKVQDTAEDGARTYYGTTLLQNAAIILPAYDTFKPRAISASYPDKAGVNKKNVAIKNGALTISASVRANGQLKPDGVKFYLVTRAGSKTDLSELLGTAAAINYDANTMTGMITFNPWACMEAGDKIFVSFVDPFKKEYVAIDTGFLFSKGMTLDTFVFGMIGSSTLEGFYSKIAELIGNPLGNIGLGSIGLTQSDPVSLFNGTQTKYTYSAGSLDKSIKSFNGKKATKKTSDGAIKPDDKKAEEAQDQQDLIDSVKDNGKQNKEKAKYQTSANFTWKFDLYAAFEFTVTQREINGEYKFCFESLSFAAGAGMDLNASVTVTMPVGFSVIVGAEIKGNLTAIYQLTTDYAGDPDHTKQIIYDANNFSLFKHLDGTSNVGYVFFNPAVLLNLTLKWTIFSVTGTAKFSFDMRFEFGKDSKGANYTKNYGDVTINLAYDIKVLSFSVYNGNKNVFTDVMFSNNVGGKEDITPTFEKIQLNAVSAVGNTINNTLDVGDQPIRLESLSREYLKDKDAFTVGGENLLTISLFGDPASGKDLSTGTTLLKSIDNVYPRSNGDLIDLGDDRIMAIYIGDAEERTSAADRTALFCGIFSSTNGAVLLPAQKIDERIDEGNYPSFYPSVSDLGNGKYAIFWSQADKSFEDLDGNSDSVKLLKALRSLNIKMRVLDTTSSDEAYGTFSAIYNVTETSGQDSSIDFGANAIYDSVSDKIVVSYTKMDYTKLVSLNDISDEETCQTVVAYRIFDNAEKEFLTYQDMVSSFGAITGKTVKGEVVRTITEENAAAEDAQWYGQLFVDTRLDRDSADFPLVVETASYYYNNTGAAVDDPGRYVAFAYVVDNDRSNKTADDRDIYALLVNLDTMEHSEVATRLTGKTGAYAQPQFVLRDGEVCLLFTAKGDIGNGEDEDTAGIAALNITTILKSKWYKPVYKDNGDKLYNVLQSNLDANRFTSGSGVKVEGANKDGEIVKPLYPAYILETEGTINRYSLSSVQYNGASGDNKICIAWLDMDKDSDSATMQIYTSVYDLKSNGADTSTFSEAFRITNDLTYNYTDCDIALGKDGKLFIIANRAPAASKTPDAETSLVLLEHDQISIPAMAEEDPLTISTDYVYADVPFAITATAKNAGDLGLASGSAVYDFYYKTSNNKKISIGTTQYYEGQIGAGAEIPCTIDVSAFDADTLKNLKSLGATVVVNDETFETEIEVKHEADMHITGEINANVKANDDTVFDVEVPIRNNGNVAAESLTLAVFKGEDKISESNISYGANSNSTSNVETKISDALYTFTETGLGYVELSARIMSGSEELASKDFVIYKQFDPEGIALGEKVTSVSMNGPVKTGVGAFIKLVPTVQGAAANEYDVVWETSEPTVVGVAADGTPYSVAEGTAVLKGTVVPASGSRVFFDGTGLPVKEDQTQFIPDHLLKTVSVEVKVEEGAEPYTPPTPVDPPYNPPAPVNPGSSTTKSYTLTFDVNGGNALEQIKAESGTIIDLTKYVPVKAGYEFEGWFSDKALTQGVSSINLKKNTTVYAKWAEKQTVSVPFVDVPNDAYFKDAVYWAVGLGITSGTWADTFSPYKLCTRAEDITFLYRAAKGAGGHDAKALYFYDVPAGSYYEDALLWAVGNGVTTGTWEGCFSPDLETSREVFVTMLYRTACLADPNAKKAGEAALAKAKNDPSLRFGDVEAGSYYEEAVYWAKEAGVVSGVGDTMIGDTWVSNAFGLGRIIDRAQIVTMLYRWFGK